MDLFEIKTPADPIPKIQRGAMRESVSWIQGRRPKIKEQYMRYLQNLSRDEAFKLKLKDTKEGYAIRNRINRAAKALGVGVHVEKVGNTILFYVL